MGCWLRYEARWWNKIARNILQTSLRPLDSSITSSANTESDDANNTVYQIDGR